MNSEELRVLWHEYEGPRGHWERGILGKGEEWEELLWTVGPGRGNLGLVRAELQMFLQGLLSCDRLWAEADRT